MDYVRKSCGLTIYIYRSDHRRMNYILAGEDRKVEINLKILN